MAISETGGWVCRGHIWSTSNDWLRSSLYQFLFAHFIFSFLATFAHFCTLFTILQLFWQLFSTFSHSVTMFITLYHIWPLFCNFHYFISILTLFGILAIPLATTFHFNFAINIARILLLPLIAAFTIFWWILNIFIIALTFKQALANLKSFTIYR